jgi:hypothetical protein
MTSRMLYLGPSILDMHEMERIYQAALFCADEILVPTSLSISPRQPKEEYNFIKSKITALSDMGIIRPWTIEGLSYPKYYRPIKNLGEAITILESEHISISDQINKNLMKFRTSQHAPRASDSGRCVVQGIGEIVEGRRMLWSIGLASTLKADRVLLNPNGAEAISYQFYSLYARSNIEQKILQEFMRVTTIGPICNLPVEEFQERRKYMPHFAKMMQERASRVNDIFSTEQDILKVADEMGTDFLTKADNLKKGPTWKSFLSNHYKDIVWDIIGNIFSPSIVAEYLIDILEWRKEREKNLPFYVVPIASMNQKRTDDGGK